ncbi:hypothetical protein CRG98_042138 [Punica granatum]|uniref:Uncharacterized protein n=1 Tax=Punica granatum TaxID=22663 RepID=A0A2I0I1X7_PUNGR|nr:hypothetical protein CRG98_042138 [Punica granatum]
MYSKDKVAKDLLGLPPLKTLSEREDKESFLAPRSAPLSSLGGSRSRKGIPSDLLPYTDKVTKTIEREGSRSGRGTPVHSHSLSGYNVGGSFSLCYLYHFGSLFLLSSTEKTLSTITTTTTISLLPIELRLHHKHLVLEFRAY